MVFPNPNVIYDIRDSKRAESPIKWYLTDQEAVLFNNSTKTVIGVYEPVKKIPRSLGDLEKAVITSHFKSRSNARFNITKPKSWLKSFWDKLTLSHTTGSTSFYTYENIRIVVAFMLDEVILKTVYPIRESQAQEIEESYNKELETLKRKSQFATAQAVLQATIKDIDKFYLKSKNPSQRSLPKFEVLDDLIKSLEYIISK